MPIYPSGPLLTSNGWTLQYTPHAHSSGYRVEVFHFLFHYPNISPIYYSILYKIPIYPQYTIVYIVYYTNLYNPNKSLPRRPEPHTEKQQAVCLFRAPRPKHIKEGLPNNGLTQKKHFVKNFRDPDRATLASIHFALSRHFYWCI